MKERFSDRARHAMALANLEASKMHHGYLAPGHLMLGLVGEGTSVATQTLRVLNVDLDRLREGVRERMAGGQNDETVGRRAHTKEMKEVISLSIKEARKFGHRYIGTEHMILGLLAFDDGIPANALKDQGIDLPTLREKALSLLGESDGVSDDVSHSRHGDFEWVHQQELSKAFKSQKFWHTLILAVDSANRLGAGEIEPQHLLLALLRDESNGIAAMLSEKDVTLDWLRERVSEMRNH